MKTALTILAACVGLAILVVLAGGPVVEPGSKADITVRQALPDTPSTPDVTRPRYFQRMLITFGDDIRSPFGSALSMLGLSGRDLQNLPVSDAFQRAHALALRVGDAPMRRKILLELFNEVEE